MTMDFFNDVQRMQIKGPETFLNATTTARYTNKTFLIEEHEKSLRYLSSNLFETSNNQMVITIQQTVTFDIKSSALITLSKHNRVDIKTIAKSINQPLKNKYLLCRSICPPFKMTAVATVVDDPEGELCVRLSLYNYDKDISYRSKKDISTLLPVGTVLAIINPWFKTTADHGLSVRCDNPADVVLLNQSTLDDVFPKLKWNGEIPLKYQPKEFKAPDSCLDWKRIGNEHFISKRYQDAVSAYTNALEVERQSEIQLNLLSNRSAAYLGLTKYKVALIDAESALSVDKEHIKSIYRKAKALFGMALYDDALEFLSKLPVTEISQKNSKVINDLLAKGKSFIAQSKNGEYPWQEFCNTDGSDENLDLAEYNGPVHKKTVPLKGRGLFATETIKAGQLILASKAFAFAVDKDTTEIHINLNSKTNIRQNKTRAQLVSTIAHILKENPQKCADVYNLYAGPELGYLTYEGGVQSQIFHVDIKRIDAICDYNTFGCSRGSLGVKNNVSERAGLWITPSYINHSCVDSNSSVVHFGNFIFIRAFHEILAGQEILISYISPTDLISQRNLDHYDFVCDCRLCMRDLRDNKKIQAQRFTLVARLEAIMEKHKGNTHAHVLDLKADGIEISNILKLFNNTRKDAPELNLCLFPMVVSLCGSYYYKNKYFLECASILVKLFETIETIAAFSVYLLEICVNIVAAFVKADQIPMAQNWLQILKTKSTLIYGTWNIIYTSYPSTVELMQQFGLDI